MCWMDLLSLPVELSRLFTLADSPAALLCGRFDLCLDLCPNVGAGGSDEARRTPSLASRAAELSSITDRHSVLAGLVTRVVVLKRANDMTSMRTVFVTRYEPLFDKQADAIDAAIVRDEDEITSATAAAIRSAHILQLSSIAFAVLLVVVVSVGLIKDVLDNS